MTTWAQSKTERRPPAKTIMVKPPAFADEWPQKPTEPVLFGLRLMSEAQRTTARAEAERIARELHEEDEELYQEARDDLLLRFGVAYGLCDPNDARKPHPLLPQAEDQVREALSPAGAKFIHDELYRYYVECSPLHMPATDEDAEELMQAIDEGALTRLPPHIETLVRRFIGYALDEIIREQANDPN